MCLSFQFRWTLNTPIWCLQNPADAAVDPSARATPFGQHLGDIRFDEDYARFYEMYSGQRKLPQPVEGRTLYQEVPGLFPSRLQQQLSAGGQVSVPSQILSRGVTPGGEDSDSQLRPLCEDRCSRLKITRGARWYGYAGLEVIDEQGPAQDIAALHEGMIQAFQQLGKGWMLGRGGGPYDINCIGAGAMSAGVRGPSPMQSHLNIVSPVGSKPGTPSPLDGEHYHVERYFL